ncbi:Dimeric alpha-beta barrel [Penicillium fimorum]|uniref:Dimeric alpha-beta barrel n=1 Tax=Penicillium fimorum TaxID=1882269 RepID=A0A9X0C6U5_9EURO|nr:Dimeric alpha-beta barrel [Penicillium fimorum]
MSRLTLRTITKMAPIERITLFKIPNEADRDRVLEQYKVLAKTATKDGKPYIVAAAVGASIPDARNKGYNLSVKTTFASIEDMKYYDGECEAHKLLKACAGPVKEDVLMTYYENIL